jgi:hypothetical protein
VTERPLPRPPLAVEIEVLESRSELVRVHHQRFRPAEFNATAVPRARFRPFGDPVVPTMFAARDDDTALAESVFHDVPVRGLRQLPQAALDGRVLSRLACARDLRLLALHGYGLQRLGVTHGELIECGPAEYPWTARWGEALHAAAPDADGLVWMARRFTGRSSIMLFGDRVGQDDLEAQAQPLELWRGPGLELALEAAQQAGIGLLI